MYVCKAHTQVSFLTSGIKWTEDGVGLATVIKD